MFTTTNVKYSSYSIQNKYVLANIFLYLNDIDSAINLLEKALSLAESERYIRSFIDGGSIIKELIQNIIANGQQQNRDSQVELDYLTQLLEEFDWEAKRLEKIKSITKDK